MSILIHKTIEEQHHEHRVDQVLALLLPQYSRSQLTRWIKTGCVQRNDKSIKPSEKVHLGDRLVINLPSNNISAHEKNFLPQNIPLSIVHEDEEVLIINKQANLVVHPGAGNLDSTLVNALVYHRPALESLPRAGIIHRLDKDTTGLLIVAKSLTTHTELVRQMQAREIHRDYYALVRGQLINSATIHTYFGRDPYNRLKMAVVRQGKEAITHYFIKERLGDFTFLNVKLLTGRTHQIRVHLAHIHHPIVGDPLYGGRSKCPHHASATLRHVLEAFKRQALHASRLTFIHPITHQSLTCTAPLPHDFDELLKLLRLHNEGD